MSILNDLIAELANELTRITADQIGAKLAQMVEAEVTTKLEAAIAAHEDQYDHDKIDELGDIDDHIRDEVQSLLSNATVDISI